MEVGPWRIDGDHGLKTVEGGWEEYTTMVYSEMLFTCACSVNLTRLSSRPARWDRVLLHRNQPMGSWPTTGTHPYFCFQAFSLNHGYAVDRSIYDIPGQFLQSLP
jgi:hypothetical protein